MISVQFRKKTKGSSFCGGWVKELETFTKHLFRCYLSKNILSRFLLSSPVCYQDDLSESERNKIASSTARNFNNNWLLTLVSQNFRNNKPLPKYLTDRKLKMWAVLFFEIKDTKKDKIFNFLKGRFFVMGAPTDMIFGLFSDIYVRLPKSITSQFFSRYSKNYINVNVKSCLKLNGP